MADRRRPYPCSSYTKNSKKLKLSPSLNNPLKKSHVNPKFLNLKTVVFIPMLQKNKSSEDVLDIKDKLTTRGNVVKNHTLRGKNRGSTLWDRRHSIPR